MRELYFRKSFLKKSLCTLVLFFLTSLLIAQRGRVLNPTAWGLLPKEAYVGDRVELRCTIAPSFELLPPDVDFISRDFLPEEAWGWEDSFASKKILAGQKEYPVSVYEVSVQRVEGGYSVSVILTPWLPGEIEAGYLELTTLPEIHSLIRKIFPDPLMVELPKIEIASIAERMGASQLRPVAPPVLVPGSIYVVYGFGMAALVLLIGLIVVLAKFRQVRLFFKGLASRIRLSKNHRQALRQLKKLAGENLDAQDLAARIEGIARRYLEVRFASPFTAAATGEIMVMLSEIFVGMFSDEQLDAVESLCILLRRCDYLRYAPNAQLEAGEGEKLIQSLQNFINFMEGQQ